MIKLKEIERILDTENLEYGRDYWRSENNQNLIIRSCCLGDNFYDYGEIEPSLIIDDERLKGLENDFRIYIVRCADCGCCAGW